jgi:hypothetical protein
MFLSKVVDIPDITLNNCLINGNYPNVMDQQLKSLFTTLGLRTKSSDIHLISID